MSIVKALLIGESWGVNEQQYRHPFIGYSGQELARMCGESKLCPALEIICKHCHRKGVFGYCACGKFNPTNFLEMIKFWARARNSGVGVTNVFHEHPDKDNEQLFFGSRTVDICLDIPPFQTGNKKLYLLKSSRHHLEALEEEISTLAPNILIPLGN